MKDAPYIAVKAHRPIEIRRIQGSVQRKGGEAVISSNDLEMLQKCAANTAAKKRW